MTENSEKFRIPLILLGLLIIAIASIWLADSHWIDQMTTFSIASLDEKKETVVALTALAGTTSTAITLIPGDVGGPIAQNIADIADYLLIVFAGIWLQKYLLSVTSIVALKILVPIACLIFAGNLYFKNDRLKRMAMKITLFGVLILTVIPMSIGISNKIEDTYESSINHTFEQAQDATAQVEENQGILQQFTNATNNLMEKFETALGNMIDSAAVLIITTCIGPILVFLFSIWATNLILGLNHDINIPKIRAFSRMKKR